MTVRLVELRTDRGDEVTTTLFYPAGQPPSILVTVNDGDDSLVPTVELTLAEAAELESTLRVLREEAHRGRRLAG